MKNQTESVIASICAADETIKKTDMLAALSLLRGEKNEAAEASDFPLTRAEAAEMLRVSRVTISAWAKRGVIRRMSIPGRRKAVGYSRRSVMEILNGDTAKGKEADGGKDGAK